MDFSKRCRTVATVATDGGLPVDPLVEILSRFPVKSLCQFKCVCKAWRDLIADPTHGKKLQQAMKGLFLMEAEISREGDEQCSFIDLMTPRSEPLDIDPCFSFLTKLEGIEALALQDSCNGLLLFEHRSKSNPDDVLGYIVCNPTTKQWVTVPACGCPPAPPSCESHIYLAFDPAASAHFNLVLFRKLWKEDEEDQEYEYHEYGYWGDEEDEEYEISVHAYSSEIGVWSHSQTDWDEEDRERLIGWSQRDYRTHEGPRHAFFNGMLHLIIRRYEDCEDQILVVDVRGKIQRMIPTPMMARWMNRQSFDFIAQSQGCLHYINEVFDHRDQEYKVSIWVLQDYSSQEWVLKEHVNILKLLGKMSSTDHVVAIHQDRNVVFFVQSSNQKLIAYDIDRKEVSVFAISGNQNLDGSIAAPYVPCFSESPTLTNKH